MRQAYYKASGWGWDPAKKAAELSHSTARFILVHAPLATSKDGDAEPGTAAAPLDMDRVEPTTTAAVPEAPAASGATVATPPSAPSPVEEAGSGSSVSAQKQTQASAQQVKDQLVAFAHFRFEVDDEDDPLEPVLYVYELQVRATCDPCPLL